MCYSGDLAIKEDADIYVVDRKPESALDQLVKARATPKQKGVKVALKLRSLKNLEPDPNIKPKKM